MGYLGVPYFQTNPTGASSWMMLDVMVENYWIMMPHDAHGRS